MAIFKKMLFVLACLSGCLAILHPAAAADSYPSRPIRLIVPFPPGGNIDFTARLLAPVLSAALKQSAEVVVVNMPGAEGSIGAGYVARAKPDGYTLLLGSSGAVSSSPALNPAVTYNPINDFTALGGIQSVPIVLTVAYDSPINNLRELVAYAKQNKPVTIAATGFGSPAHLTIEHLIKHVALNAVYVPYQGSGPALTNLVGGQVFAMADQVNSSLPFLTSKKIKAIVQFGKTRSSLLPNVPTLAEEGFPGYVGISWTGLFAPAHLPKNVQAALGNALQTALTDTALIRQFKDVGAEMMTMSQGEFREFVASDFRKWQAFAKTSDSVKPQ